MLNISTATTAELVAYFNKHSAKPVKKFADRKTAERRVAALMVTLPKAPAKKASPAKDRGEAIAASWQDKRVAAARATRHHVKAAGNTYKSVREAFMVLALPLGQHIKFRGALKAAGRAEFAGVKFQLVERE